MAGDEVWTAEAAQLLGVSQSTVLRMVARGTLTPSHKAPGKRGAFAFNRTEVERAAAKIHAA
jgi:excisionase family DNA binding protein